MMIRDYPRRTRRPRLPDFPILNGIWRPLFHIGFWVKCFLAVLFGFFTVFAGHIFLYLAWGSFLMFFALQFFERTIGGDDALGDWEEIDLHGSFRTFLWVGLMLLASLAPGLLLYFLIENRLGSESAAYFFPVLPASVVLLFPLLLLGGMLEEPGLNPIPFDLFRSLAARWFSWTIFYIVSVLSGVAVLAALAMLGFWIGENREDVLAVKFVAAVSVSILSTAWIFFYARLLGRLAWIIEEWHREECR